LQTVEIDEKNFIILFALSLSINISLLKYNHLSYFSLIIETMSVSKTYKNLLIIKILK